MSAGFNFHASLLLPISLLFVVLHGSMDNYLTFAILSLDERNKN